MNTNAECKPSRWIQRFLCVASLTAILLPVQAYAALTRGFTSPSTNSSEGAVWTGAYSFDTDEFDRFTITVTRGGHIVPPANITTNNTSTNVVITLTPVTNTAGRVFVDLAYWKHPSASNPIATNSFEVVFLPVPTTAVDLTLAFSSPATNSAPGASFSGGINFTPADPSVHFTASILSGTDIVPQANISLTTNSSSGVVTAMLAPVTNKSGTVTARVTGEDTFTTNTVDFTINFRRYPPAFSPITPKTINEDTSTNISFTVSYPDGTPATAAAVTVSSSNTNLIDAADMGLGGINPSRTLSLTPKADINGNSTITLTATDTDHVVTTNFLLTVSPVTDPSTIGSATNVTMMDNAGAVNILPGIVIADVDHLMPVAETLSVTVTLGNGDLAKFIDGTTSKTVSGNPATVTASVRALQILAVPFRGTPGTVNNLSATVSVSSPDFTVHATNNIAITVSNNDPSLLVTLSPDTLLEGTSIQPFTLDFLFDSDLGEDLFTLLIEIADPAQAGLGSITPTNTLTGNQGTLQSAIQGLSFAASSGGIASTNPVEVALRVTAFDGFGGSGVETNFITIHPVLTPPTIGGIPAETRNITDGDTDVVPFPTVFTSDPDQGGVQLVSAVLTQSNPALGTFSQTVFPLQTQSLLTDALRNVSYNPIPGALPVGDAADTLVTVTVTDATGLSAQNNSLTIRVRSVNNAPAIINVPDPADQPELIPPAATILPFQDLGLRNDDPQNVTFTIRIDNPAKGTLGNLGGFTPTATSGEYAMTGTTNAVLQALTNITYALSVSYPFPLDDPGGTTFTLTVRDYALLTTTRSLYIQIQDEPRNHLVVRAANDGLPGSFNYALTQIGNNDVITFALPSWPAVIRMPGTTANVLTRSVTLKGPGAGLLTISGDSNGDGVPDRQLFAIGANVTIEGMTLSRGTASFGGAIQVQQNGMLTLRHVAVTDSVAGQYGGAIDVEGGSLVLDGCFIGRNSLRADTGRSGAGVSIYSDEHIRIMNTTFADNSQPNPSGDGGGALAVETVTKSTPLNVSVTHCTFAGNRDASGWASAIIGIGENAYIRPVHSIFNDFSGRNLSVFGGGLFVSGGGNICDDSTQVPGQQAGQPGAVYLLDHVNDLTLTSARLTTLNSAGDPTPYFGLQAASPARDIAFASLFSLDQRGVLREGIADAGAIEYQALGRLVINEIMFDDGELNFIELFVRRDSTPIDLSPFSLFINGEEVHRFADGTIIATNTVFPTAGAAAPLMVNPGFGMVVAFTNAPFAVAGANNPAPFVAASEEPGRALATRGIITVGIGGTQQPVARQAYLGTFLNPVNGTNLLDIAGNAIALAPQYRGFALVPHALILPGPYEGIDPARPLNTNTRSPGADVLGTPFGQDNAEPLARADLFTVSEDEFAVFDLVANDYDGDGNDRLVIVDISAATAAGTGDTALTNSTLGAEIAVDPVATPLRRTRVSYDPRAVLSLQQLPVGVEVIDIFYYEIIDIGSASVQAYAADGGATRVTAVNHRLTNDAQIVISGANAAYNGTHAVTVLGDDTFTIPVAFMNNNAPRGFWETVLPRAPTTRSETAVTVRVTGVNDAPVAVPDVITNVTERSVVRLMTRPELAGSVITFPTTDPVPAPLMLTQDLLGNDDDIDTDDTWANLRVAGVLPAVHAITDFAGTVGQVPVSVQSPGHGLASGTQVLIANYGGHPSYNGYHTVTVVDADTFTIPRSYVDNHVVKGLWVVLNETNRYQAVTDAGARVRLVRRSNVQEDHLLYDASASAYLRGLAEGELFTNRFWYAVEDSHGAIGIGPVDVIVTGVNDPPVPLADPDSLSVLAPLVGAGTTLAEVLESGLDLMYALPPLSGTFDRTDLHVLDLGGTLAGTLVLRDVFSTDEDTLLNIAALDLLANDSDIDRLDSLRVESVDGLSREGAVINLFSGVISYDPTLASNLQSLVRGELLVDTFSVVVADDMTGGSVTSLVAVLVSGVNDSPLALPDTYNTHEDEVFVFDPRGNDTDIDINGVVPDDRLGIVPATDFPNPGQARVDMSSTNVSHDATASALLDQLADWQSYTNTFMVAISDNSFLFAVDDQFHLPAGNGARVLDVLANDRDYTDAVGLLTIVNAGPALHGGTVAIGTGGVNLVYSPPTGFAGDDYFRYTIRNDRGDEDSAVVMVRTVAPTVNGLLYAANDQFAVAAGESVILDVTANDNLLPATGAGFTISAILDSTLPGQPVLTNNTVLYTAPAGNSVLTFTYEVNGGGTAVAQAAVTVLGIERRGVLTIQDDAFSVLPGSIGNALDVLGNDLLVTESKAALRIRAIVTPATYGTLTTNAAGTGLVYTPDADFIGVEQVRYTATDRIGGTGTGTVHISVGRIETARDYFTAEATNTAPVALDVLANDRLLPALRGGTLTLVSNMPASAAIGTLAINGNKLAFTSSGVVGQQDFSYVVEDASVPPRIATGIVTVDTVPAGTYANPDVYTVRGNGADYVLDVLANDIGYPGTNRPYAVLSVGSPDQGGSVQIAENKLVYTPAADFFGAESFSYTMSDGSGTDQATVTVTVRRGDLVAGDDFYAVYYEVPSGGSVPRSFSLPVVLNDRIQPPMDQVLTISDLGTGTNAPDQGGTVQIAPDGLSLTYRPGSVPAPEYTETFTYEINDGAGRRSAARVAVRVQNLASNLVAVTQDDVYNVARSSVNNLLPVLANDFVKPGSAAGWTITGVSAALSGGTVSVSGNALRYSPPAGFVGVDQFTYNVSDGLGGTGSAVVTLRIGSLPLLPDRLVVLSGSASNVVDVLANDVLLDSYAAEYTLHSVFGADAGGTVWLSGSNTVLYTPDAAYAGAYPYSERFFYRVADDSGVTVTGQVDVVVHAAFEGLSAATVSLIVAGRNDQPTITNVAANLPITDKQTAQPFLGVTISDIDRQTTEPVDVLVWLDDPAKGILSSLGSFTDLGGGAYSLTNVPGATATLQITNLVFEPTPNRITVPTTEATRFTISVTDNKSPSVVDTNTAIAVTAVNDAPSIGGTQAGQEFYYRLPIQPFSTVVITEIDDLVLQPLTVTVMVMQPNNGQFGGLGDFTAAGGGVYWIEGITAAEATAQLRAMAFFVNTAAVPFGGSQTTQFRITVNDSFAPPVSDQATSVIAHHPFDSVVRPASSLLQGTFGQAVDTIADYAVVGAPNAQVSGTNSGAAFIYRRDTAATNLWTQWRQLQPATVLAGDRFGRSVAMTDERVAVGAINDDTAGADTGAVYLFERDLGGTNNWGELLRVVPTNLTAMARFGFSVALDGDLLAVGAPDADLSGTGIKAGAVLLFGRNQGGTNAWGEIRRWAPSDAGSTNALFGQSVALSGDRLLVGAPLYNVVGGASVREGAVFLLSRDQGGTGQWGRVQTLVAPDSSLSREFGWEVAIDGALAAVGAPAMTAGTVTNAGRVFIYEIPGGTNVFSLVHELDRRNDAERRFGHSVSVSGNQLFAGAPHHSGPQNLGAAYLFDRPDPAGSIWTLAEKFTRPAGNTAGLFGTAVRYRQGTAVVGAPSDLADFSNRGYAFMYRFGYNTVPVFSYSLEIDPSSRNHDSGAVTGQTFSVVASAFWTATRVTADDWITITDGSAGGGNGTVTYSIATNNVTTPRSGLITVSGGGITRTFMVNQAGTAPVLSINPASRDHVAAGAAGQTIAVTGNVAWTASETNTWISITGGAAGSGNGTVTYSVSTNTVITPRSGTIMIAGGGVTNTFTVNQAGAAPALSINPASRDHVAAGAAGQTIAVTGNVAWTASETNTWISITGGAAGSGNGTVTYSIVANTVTTPRSGTITVAGGGITNTFTVNQAGAAPVLAINPSSRDHVAAGASGQTVGVTGNVAWTATNSVAWISITGGAAGSGAGTVTYSVAANAALTARSGTITVAGEVLTRTFTVNQAASLPPVALGDAVDAPELTWTTGGPAAWFGQTETTYDGVDAAQSGDITHGQQSWLQTTVTGPGIISFRWKVSSEAGADFLRVSANGDELDGAISGDSGWVRKQVLVPAGNWTLRWFYTKDGAGDAGDDGGWVDQILWQPALAANDFDGDRKSDLGYYHPPTGSWRLLLSDGGTRSNTFGYAGTIPITGDFDGDGVVDYGCYDPNGIPGAAAPGSWYIMQSRDGFRTETFGYGGTVPITGDFDGDGITDFGCYDAAGIPGRVSPGSWYIMQSRAGFRTATFGYGGTVPITGDFDGDGKADFGCYDAAGIYAGGRWLAEPGSWYLMQSRDGFRTETFGYSGTVPVAGDFDGDGVADFGCYDAAGFFAGGRWLADPGSWYLMQSRAGFRTETFGYGGTVPVVGDYDGDGVADFGCYDAAGIPGTAASGSWYIMQSRDGFRRRTWGAPGTIPLGK